MCGRNVPQHGSRGVAPLQSGSESESMLSRGACSSSRAGVSSWPERRPLIKGAAGISVRVAWRPVLRFVHASSEVTVGEVLADCSVRREAAVCTSLVLVVPVA